MRTPCAWAAGAAASSDGGGATSSERLLQLRPVRVADGHSEGIRRVVGRRRLGQRQQGAHHPLHLVLRGRAASAHRLLHSLRRVREARDARHAGGKKHDPAGLAHREGAVGVAAEVEVLDRERIGECSRIRSLTRAWIWASRRSSGMPGRVSITPPSSAASRPPCDSTTPYPVLAVPGSMPRTITDNQDSAASGGRLPWLVSFCTSRVGRQDQ